MNFFKQGSLFIVVLLMLTGCISIPLGDSFKLELGKDGIDITKNEEKNDPKESKSKANEDEISTKEEISVESVLGLFGELESLLEDGLEFDGDGEGLFSLGEDGELDFNLFGDSELDWVTGDHLTLPFEMPHGIPIASDNNIIQYMHSDDVVFVHYLSGNKTEEVIKLYEDYFNKQKFIDGPTKTEHGDSATIMNSYRGEAKEGIMEVSDSGAPNDIGVTVTIAYRTDIK